MPDSVKLTLVTESAVSFYSGMLPGAVSSKKIYLHYLLELYSPSQIQIQLEPLAKWCKADYVEQRVARIVGNENKILLEDGSSIDYDYLIVNVGSRTRGSH